MSIIKSFPKGNNRILHLLLSLVTIFFVIDSKAQDYILGASLYGSSATPDCYLVDGNSLYTLGHTNDINFQTTDGSTLYDPSSYRADIYFLKYNALTMQLQEARLFGSEGDEWAVEIKKVGSYLYAFSRVHGLGMPSTTWGGYKGGVESHLLKLDLDGNVVAAAYLGGSGDDLIQDVEIVNGIAHMVVMTNSSDYTVTDNSTLKGTYDIVYHQIDLASMNLNYASYIGGNNFDAGGKLAVDSSSIYLGFSTISSDLPVTDSSTHSGTTDRDIAVAKIDINTAAITGMTYLGGSGHDEFIDIVSVGGELFIQGITRSNDFSVTNGSYYQTSYNNSNVVFAHYDTNFDLQTSAYVFAGNVNGPNFEYNKGYLYMAVNDTTDVVNLLKLDINGNVIWNYSNLTGYWPYSWGELKIHNDKIHFCMVINDNSLASTNGSSLTGYRNYYYLNLTLDGDLKFAGYYGGHVTLLGYKADDWLQMKGTKIWIGGRGDPCAPVTNGTSTANGGDYIMVIETCASNFQGDSTQSVPAQTICRNGFVQEIKLDHYLISGADFPNLTVCGKTVTQRDIYAIYQWQSAPGTAGPWTDIPGTNKQNYTPSPLLATTYFRRLAKQDSCCGGQILQTSEIHCVIVGPNDAPTVDAGGVYNTCPGTPTILTSTVTGGQAPYQYKWTAGNSPAVISTSPNLTATPSTTGTTIYTLTVIDAAGCQQIDQSIVNAYSANAGNDISFCDNQPGKEIGGPAIPGLPGVSYDWTPSTGLSCTNCPNPTATPSTPTQYTLTLTIPITGGGTCSTTDQITATRVVGPTPNFAGADTVICFGTPTEIGNPAESGFSYTWAPGAYLTDNTVTPATFIHGNYDFPTPNPITYYLTAEKEGCTWFDQVEVSVIRAKAYIGNLDPLCGPRFVGEGDLTPNINETWQWTQLSGDGSFTGPTNVPVTTVSASTNVTSTYELAVTYNGTTCTSIATTPPCINGTGCDVEIKVQGGIGCPSTMNYQDVCLEAIIAAGPPGTYSATWSPQVGLDTYSGPLVCLTDSVFRTYTVTITYAADSTISCSQTIVVNDPAWSKPVFTPQDAYTCSSQPVNIGDPMVSGYSYEWSSSNNLDNHQISNPLATVTSSTNFIVTVTDTQSGCNLVDTATVEVSNPYATGGADQLICNAGVFTLGSVPTANNVYSWTPTGANWQNGTNQNSAQPEVLVAINTTFVLTATDTISGCVAIDTIQIDVGQPVTPFTLPDITYCPSQDSIVLGMGIPTGSGVSYFWSPTLNVSNPNAPITSVFPLPANGQEYTVVVTNASGCSYQTTQTIVPSILPPTVASYSMCVGESVQIGSNLNPTGAGISYSWSPTTGLSSATSPNPFFSAFAAGTTTYTLTVNNNGCSNSSSAIITVNDFPVSVTPKTICMDACVNIGVTAVPGGTYTWSPAIGLNDPAIANPLACVNSNTVYTLVATGPTGCETTVQVPVYVNNSPAPQVNIPVSTFCLGTSGNTINPTVSPPGSYTYNWTPNNGTLIYPNSPMPEVVLPSPGAASYQVTITNATSGCATVATADVSMVNCDPNVLCLNTDICLELSIDPNHPLSTIDCDGDGVTNADECGDSTDPLDPCDFLAPSITLPVTADQSGCPPLCTDLTPIVKILPGNISGNSMVQVAVKISEVHAVDTDGSVISVRMPSDPRLSFVWDIGLTYAAFTPVQNADWNYLGDNGVFHNWTYNGPGLTIAGLGTSAFGFLSFYDPQGTDGQTTITASVVPFSGGECNLVNNSDSERLVYFK